MDAATLHALASLLTAQAKKARKDLDPGTYEVDAHVEMDVSGVVNVSEDESYTPTVSIPLKVTMALFMRYTGVTGEHAHAALMKAMTDALEIENLSSKDKKAAVEAIEELADLEAAEAKVRSGLDDLPKKNRKGKVNVSAEIHEGDGEPVEEAKAS